MHQLYVATRKGLFLLDARDSTYQITATAFLGDNVSMVLPLPGGRVLAALDHGHFGSKLHRSDDGGASWQEIAVPTFPPKPDDASDTNIQGQPVPWKLIRVWALEAGSDDGRELWCGTIPGGLFHSTDGGDSWSLVRSLWDHPGRLTWFGGGAEFPGIHSVCVHPRDKRHVAVGVSCGGVWITTDGGESWNCRATGMRAEYMPPDQAYEPGIQDAHRVVQCAAAPDYYWAQHHNGVFRTTDGAASWTEVAGLSPSSFGFAVAVHPAEPNTAWFVPAGSDQRRIPLDGVVVTRTRDGGATCEQLRTGLPQQHAYDLVFRHALDIDATGSRLAFGSTTGSLWTSADQGDRWQTAADHLPPIYAVRFVKSLAG